VSVTVDTPKAYRAPQRIRDAAPVAPMLFRGSFDDSGITSTARPGLSPRHHLRARGTIALRLAL